MSNEEVKSMVLSKDHKQLLTNYAKNYLAIKQIEKQMKAEIETLKKVMIENNVMNIDNGEYSLTLSPVNGVKVSGDIKDVPKQFTAIVLDAKKTNAHVTLTGKLPKGVERTVTYKLNPPKEL